MHGVAEASAGVCSPTVDDDASRMICAGYMCQDQNMQSLLAQLVQAMPGLRAEFRSASLTEHRMQRLDRTVYSPFPDLFLFSTYKCH